VDCSKNVLRSWQSLRPDIDLSLIQSLRVELDPTPRNGDLLDHPQEGDVPKLSDPILDRTSANIGMTSSKPDFQRVRRGCGGCVRIVRVFRIVPSFMAPSRFFPVENVGLVSRTTLEISGQINAKLPSL